MSSSEKCPICGASNICSYRQTESNDLYRCASCSCDFVSPMPSNRDLKKFYDREEWFEVGEFGGYEDFDKQSEATLELLDPILKNIENKTQGREILDVGCRYGTHIEFALSRGWNAFGIEISNHAREKAILRHGERALITDSIESMIPHKFDVILLLDVLEHIPDPSVLFYNMFSKGFITKDTEIIITTPNARSYSAVNNENWEFRHPPSHLMYYSAQTLQDFLKELHFKEIDLTPVYEQKSNHRKLFDDENNAVNTQYASGSGLLCRCSNSDFMSFMQERYIPGTWNVLAEYEHIPRYLMAQKYAKNKRVLDFAAGSGFGSSLLSEVAEHVTGVDIDDQALVWAKKHYSSDNIDFLHSESLKDENKDLKFDLITCFEMIEHVSEDIQKQILLNLKNLLKQDSVMIISTPNPDITKLYGENSFHIREMNKIEFEALLKQYFKHVKIFNQWILPSVLISDEFNNDSSINDTTIFQKENMPPPAAYIAICSQNPIHQLERFCYFDNNSLIDETLSKQQNINRGLEQICSLTNQLRSSTNLNLQSKLELKTLTNETEHLKAELNGIYASNSWKLVSNLRDIKAIFSNNLLMPKLKSLLYRTSGVFKSISFFISKKKYITRKNNKFSKNKRTIILVTHETSSTGAPLLGYNILKLLANRYNIINIIIREKEKVLHNLFLDNAFLTISNISESPHELSKYFLKRIISKYDISCVILNSMVNMPVLKSAHELQMPTITLIHEFGDYAKPVGTMNKALAFSTKVIVPGTMIKNSILEDISAVGGKAEPSKIVIKPQGKLKYLPSSDHAVFSEEELLKNIGIGKNQNTKIVIGGGMLHMRKGVELFISMAAKIKSRYKGECKFVWVGGGYKPNEDWDYSLWLEIQLKYAGLKDHFVFLDHLELESWNNMLKLSDVFCLTSRMDPFPNVLIDAMQHDLPIVCFEKTTCAEEFLRENNADCFIAGYLDVEDMANGVVSILKKQETKKGVNSKITENKLDMVKYVDYIDSLINTIIDKNLN